MPGPRGDWSPHRVDLDGDAYHVTFSQALATKVDWKAVAEKLAPSRQLVTAHTSQSLGYRLNVRARQLEAA